MPRLTKIYTRKGDGGFTTLRNQTLPKDDILVEAVGTIDELNAAVGIILATNQDNVIRDTLIKIQNDLFNIGGELHTPNYSKITSINITWLEERLDSWNNQLPPLQEFILPQGNLASVSTHLVRTICRRAERVMVRLHRHYPLFNLEILRYLNRLSDLFFVIARVIARAENTNEAMWQKE